MKVTTPPQTSSGESAEIIAAYAANTLGTITGLGNEAIVASDGASAADVQVLYTPTESTSFLDVTGTATGLVLTILDNVKTRILFAADPHVDPTGEVNEWSLVEVTPEVAEFGTVAALGAFYGAPSVTSA